MFASELRRQKAVLAAVDSVAVFAAFQLALRLRDPNGRLMPQLPIASPGAMLAATALLMMMWVAVFRAFDLYHFHKSRWEELKGVIKGCLTATALTVLLEFICHIFVSRVVMATGFALSVVLVLAGRRLTRALLRWFYADPKIAIPLAIFGFNDFSRQLSMRLAEDLSQYDLLGFLDDEAAPGQYGESLSVIGGTAELGKLAETHPGLELIIALPDAAPARQEELVRHCEANRIQWRLVPAFYRNLINGFRLDVAGGIPLIGPATCNIEGLNCVLKRAFDLVTATAVMLVALPVMGLVALAVRLIDGRPVLFRQQRIGIRGERFELLKFRTMRADADDQMHRAYVAKWIGSNGQAASANGRPIYKLVGDPRITRLGKFLRQTALDELPQLVNVLRGEMSLVGPRPALPYELDHYQDWHRRRLDGPPGITGLWQVAGRNRLGFDEMVRLDLQYLRSWSLGSDLRILLRTLPSVLGANGH